LSLRGSVKYIVPSIVRLYTASCTGQLYFLFVSCLSLSSSTILHCNKCCTFNTSSYISIYCSILFSLHFSLLHNLSLLALSGNDGKPAWKSSQSIAIVATNSRLHPLRLKTHIMNPTSLEISHDLLHPWSHILRLGNAIMATITMRKRCTDGCIHERLRENISTILDGVAIRHLHHHEVGTQVESSDCSLVKRSR
jgi:hypothetical protein